MSQGLEPCFQSGDPDRGRPHVNAAARLAQIERSAEDADLAWGKGLYATVQEAARVRVIGMHHHRGVNRDVCSAGGRMITGNMIEAPMMIASSA
jgi:hypothetical protein